MDIFATGTIFPFSTSSSLTSTDIAADVLAAAKKVAVDAIGAKRAEILETLFVIT